MTSSSVKTSTATPSPSFLDQGAKRRFYTANDGARLSYLEAGIPGKPSLIMLHGFGAQARFFLPQLRTLADEFYVIAPDLRGHGQSEKGPTAPSLELLASDVASLMDDLGLEKTFGLGWSMGAQVWLSYLQQENPGALAGLIVEDMTPRVLIDASWQQGARGLDRAVNEKILVLMETAWEDYCAFFEPALFARPTEQSEETLSWVQEIKTEGDPAFLANLWRSLLDQDFRPLLPQLTLPLLVAHGGKSHFYDQAVADYWLAHCPQAHEQLFADCGHTPHLEEAPGFTAMLRKTLQAWQVA